MLEWIENLDPTVQAALIAGITGIVIALINGKKKKDNIVSKEISTNQTNSGSNSVSVGEQNQDGTGNIQNTYINCNIQPTPQHQENDDFEDRMDKYMREHTATNEDIDKLFDDDTIPEDDTTEEKRITTIDNAVVVRMKNLAGGNTVLIGDEKTITEQIIKEHDEEIERALNEI